MQSEIEQIQMLWSNIDHPTMVSSVTSNAMQDKYFSKIQIIEDEFKHRLPD